MWDILETCRRRTDPLAELALSSLPLREWPAIHIGRLACWAEETVSHFKPRSYFCWHYRRQVTCKNRWIYNDNGGCSLIMDQPESTIEIVPAKGFGFAIFLKSNILQNRRSKDHRYVLTTADTSETIIALSSIELAQKLAVPAYQRAWLGNYYAPLPGLKWRPLPNNYWDCIFSDDNRALALAPALNGLIVDWRLPKPETNKHRNTCDEHVEETYSRISINFGDQHFERYF